MTNPEDEIPDIDCEECYGIGIQYTVGEEQVTKKEYYLSDDCDKYHEECQKCGGLGHHAMEEDDSGYWDMLDTINDELKLNRL